MSFYAALGAFLSGEWTPRVIPGEDTRNFVARVPYDVEEAKAFQAGFEEGLRGRAGQGDMLNAPRAWRSGYAVGREIREMYGPLPAVYEAAVSQMRALIRGRADPLAAPRPHARKRRDMDKGYEITNRPPMGSARGTVKHAGGPRLSSRALAEWFARSDNKPAHSSGAFWTDGITCYSYKQPIARKRMQDRLDNVAYFDSRRFSPTTSKHQSFARYALEMAGWRLALTELRRE